MAYEYRLPPIDIDGAIKAVQDNAFRQEQLRLKYEESMNKSIDDEERLYSGKVRKQDIGEFGSVFAAYADAKKRYQSLNRRGGRGGDLTIAKAEADMSRKSMDAYITESTSLGQTQIGLGKIFKDSTKLVNTNKFNETYIQMSNMTTNELKQLYGGDLKKIPTNFEFKQEDYGPDKVIKFSNAIKSVLPISSQSSFSRAIPAIDPNTGKQKTSRVTISALGKSKVIDVPLNVIKAGIDPITTLNAVISAAGNDDDTMNYMKSLMKSTFSSAEDASNPQAQQEANDRIKRTMDMFGIKDKSLVNEKHLFASNYVDQARMGDIEIEDWNKLDDYIGIFQKDNALKLDDLQMKKLKKDITDPSSGTSLKVLGQLLSVYQKAAATGLTNVKDWQETFIRVFRENGLPMDKETIIKASAGQFGQAQSAIDLLFPGRVPSADER